MVPLVTRSGVHIETCKVIRAIEQDDDDTRVEMRTDHSDCNDAGVFYISELGKKWRRKDRFYVNTRVDRCPNCRRKFRMRIPVLLVVEARLR